MNHLDPSFEDGDAELDEGHRELLQRLGAVLAAVAAGDRGSARRLMARLQQAMADHFAAEQGRMAELEDLALPRHREAHETFLADFARLRWELEHRGLSPLFQLWVSTRPASWLRLHARTFDAELALSAR